MQVYSNIPKKSPRYVNLITGVTVVIGCHTGFQNGQKIYSSISKLIFKRWASRVDESHRQWDSDTGGDAWCMVNPGEENLLVPGKLNQIHYTVDCIRLDLDIINLIHSGQENYVKEHNGPHAVIWT